MSRIIAGTHKGRRLHAVPTDATRPTSDRVKESLFSRLEGYDALIDAVVVDLFAGSGALGFEALSRGAASVELVDKAEAAHRTLSRNAALFGPAATVHKPMPCVTSKPDRARPSSCSSWILRIS